MGLRPRLVTVIISSLKSVEYWYQVRTSPTRFARPPSKGDQLSFAALSSYSNYYVVWDVFFRRKGNENIKELEE